MLDQLELTGQKPASVSLGTMMPTSSRVGCSSVAFLALIWIDDVSVVPTRYGRAVAQVSAFFDMTGGLWATQALNGKMATIIISTGTQHGA